MTPAVASERSIFSKNHDYNNYIHQKWYCPAKIGTADTYDNATYAKPFNIKHMH